MYHIKAFWRFYELRLELSYILLKTVDFLFVCMFVCSLLVNYALWLYD